MLVVVGEAYADVVMGGGMSFKKAVYILFYRYKLDDAFTYFDRMNNAFYQNKRTDVYAGYDNDRIKKIIRLALTNRAKYFAEHGRVEEAKHIIFQRDHSGL